MVNSLTCLSNPKAEYPSQKTSALGVESVTGSSIFSLPTDINMASISSGVNSIPGNECDELEDCKPTAVKLEMLEELFGGGWDDGGSIGGGSLMNALSAHASSISTSSLIKDSKPITTLSESANSNTCLDAVMPQLPLLTCHDFRLGGSIMSDVSSTLSPPTLTPRPPQAVLNAANAMATGSLGRVLKIDPSLEESNMPNIPGIPDHNGCFSPPSISLTSNNFPPKLSLGALASISRSNILNSNNNVSTLSSPPSSTPCPTMGIQRQQQILSTGLRVIIPASPLHPDTTTLNMCSPASIAGSSIDGTSNNNSGLNTSNAPISPSSAMLSPTALADASSSSSINKKTIFTAKGKGKAESVIIRETTYIYTHTKFQKQNHNIFDLFRRFVNKRLIPK